MTKFELQRKYNISRYNLLALIILSIVNIVTLIYMNTIFLFSLSFPRIVQSVIDELIKDGTLNQDQINYPVVIFIMVLPIVLFLLCYIFSSKNRYKVFIITTVLFAIDTIFSILTLDPIDIIFHIYIFVLLIYGVVYGKKLAKGQYKEIQYNTTTSIDEEGNTVEVAVSNILRRDEPKGRVIVKAEYNGLNITVKRRRGLTELIINDNVFDEFKGFIEKDYQLNAMVKQTEIIFNFQNGRMFLYANGELVIKKMRWI